MESLLELPETLKLLKSCWSSAENSARDLFTKKYKIHTEVTINQLFYGELSERFRKANDRNAFSQAVLTDLAPLATSPSLMDAARRITAGIVARVSYHEPQVEVHTGGDLGLTVIRPSFTKARSCRGFSSWLHEQGLLCQAKRQTKDGKWGLFTQKQKEVLPKHIRYLILLLYGYSGPRRDVLDTFMWKSCANNDLETINKWLHSNVLDGIIYSPEVIELLGNGKLGTDDEKTIEEVICAGNNSYLKVEITWPKGPPPDPDSPPPRGEESWFLKQKTCAQRQQQTFWKKPQAMQSKKGR